jgi:hypothetical protein
MKKQKKLERKWRRMTRRANAAVERSREEQDDLDLIEGRIKREELKEVLLEYLNNA